MGCCRGRNVLLILLILQLVCIAVFSRRKRVLFSAWKISGLLVFCNICVMVLKTSGKEVFADNLSLLTLGFWMLFFFTACGPWATSIRFSRLHVGTDYRKFYPHRVFNCGDIWSTSVSFALRHNGKKWIFSAFEYCNAANRLVSRLIISNPKTCNVKMPNLVSTQRRDSFLCVNVRSLAERWFEYT